MTIQAIVRLVAGLLDGAKRRFRFECAVRGISATRRVSMTSTGFPGWNRALQPLAALIISMVQTVPGTAHAIEKVRAIRWTGDSLDMDLLPRTYAAPRNRFESGCLASSAVRHARSPTSLSLLDPAPWPVPHFSVVHMTLVQTMAVFGMSCRIGRFMFGGVQSVLPDGTSLVVAESATFPSGLRIEAGTSAPNRGESLADPELVAGYDVEGEWLEIRYAPRVGLSLPVGTAVFSSEPTSTLSVSLDAIARRLWQQSVHGQTADDGRRA